MVKRWSISGRYILPILRHHARVWGRITNLFSNCSQNMSDFTCLQAWAEKFLPASSIIKAVVAGSTDSRQSLLLEPLNGDAGFRKYFRLNTEPSLIAVSAPPSQEDNPAFVNVSLFLQQYGLHTPLIVAVDYQQGFLLLEDFGDQLLLSQLSLSTANMLYGMVETELLKLQQAPLQQLYRGSLTFPDYDRQKLLDEMNLFTEWFVGQLLNIELQSVDRQLLDETFSILADSALSQQQVIVHRDFHSRNLMLLADDSVGVIDFQDAVTGPFTYDLVSLLRDCYIRWPTDYVSERALNYYRRAEALGIVPQAQDSQILRWFDLMGLQRHIKVLGIFSRLWLRDGKASYLDDLPLVIRYTLEQLEPYPELKNFKEWLEQRVLPQLPKQTWYQPWETAGDLVLTNRIEQD